MGIGGGRDSDGDFGSEELSPVLGITGNRLLTPRLTGLGVSNTNSLRQVSVTKLDYPADR